MTVTNSNKPDFRSNDEFLIWIIGLRIANGRNLDDKAWLNNSLWSGTLVGTDGYPKSYYGYLCIGGGKNG